MNSTFNGSLYLASSSQKFTLNTCNELDESIQNGNRSQPRKKGESERNINWTPHFQCCIWSIWRVHTCAKCPRKADNMFNRNNIEIFINTTQLLIFIWRKTLPTDTKKKKKSPHNFSFSIFSFAYSFHASTFFCCFLHQVLWLLLPRHDRLNHVCIPIYVVAFPSQTFHRLISLLSNSFSLDIIDNFV